MLRIFIHYFLHFGLPWFIAKKIDSNQQIKIYIILIFTNLVDLDHLLADPVFDPNRCSIGFHTLHSTTAILFYFILLFIPNFYIRLVSTGLILHMLIDTLDCLWI